MARFRVVAQSHVGGFCFEGQKNHEKNITLPQLRERGVTSFFLVYSSENRRSPDLIVYFTATDVHGMLTVNDRKTDQSDKLPAASIDRTRQYFTPKGKAWDVVIV